MNQSIIKWPDGLDYKIYPVHSYNELFIPARAEDTWERLTNAEKWPEWYSNARNVKVLGENRTLRASSEFIWETFGLKVRSRVLVFRPYSDLGWSAREWFGRGFHGWKIIPQSGGCLVVTEEVQTGFLVRLFKRKIKKSLETQHQIWLESLSRIAKIKIK